MPLLARLAAALLLGGMLPAAAGAQGIPPALVECWEDVRLFESLATGTVDYCRDHLRYTPGALDCQRLIDRVCSVVLPVTGEWTELRQPRTRLRFACPDGPPPPVCRRLDLQ